VYVCIASLRYRTDVRRHTIMTTCQLRGRTSRLVLGGELRLLTRPARLACWCRLCCPTNSALLRRLRSLISAIFA
jgi:hypothetical protein